MTKNKPLTSRRARVFWTKARVMKMAHDFIIARKVAAKVERHFEKSGLLIAKQQLTCK